MKNLPHDLIGRHVVVTGGRDFDQYDKLDVALCRLKPKLVVQGGARGADRLAKRWAQRRRVPCETFSADWLREGKSAGPRRNRRMLEANPDALVLACPGGRGTADCVGAAKRRGMVVLHLGDLLA